MSRNSDQPLLKVYKVPIVSESRISVVDLIKLSLKFGLTSLGQPQYSVYNMEREYMQKGIVTKDQFDSFRAIIYRSLGLTALNMTFLIGFYKIGFFAALAGVVAFTLPNILFMYILSFFAHNINQAVFLNILLVGVRGASAAAVFRNAQLFQNTLFTNILTIFTLIMCLLFSQNTYIYFLLYLIGAVLATFSKNIKKIEFPNINLNTSLSKPAIIIYSIIMLSLWILAKNFENALLKMTQLITLIMSFTLYTTKGYIAIFYGQFSSIHQNFLPDISVEKMQQVMRNMLGICFILPGSDLKIIIIMCNYFFGFKGFVVSVLSVYGFSILLIVIFIKYAKVLVQSRIYRKMYEGLNSVNKGFCLLFAIRSLQAETCQKQTFVMIFLVVSVLLHTINPRRHMMIFFGIIIAFTRKFSLWNYRNIDFDQGICYIQ